MHFVIMGSIFASPKKIHIRYDLKGATYKGRYEAIEKNHHDHLIDIESGEIHEFTNNEIESIQKAVAKELGYNLVDHRLELYGIKIKK